MKPSRAILGLALLSTFAGTAARADVKDIEQIQCDQDKKALLGGSGIQNLQDDLKLIDTPLTPEELKHNPVAAIQAWHKNMKETWDQYCSNDRCGQKSSDPLDKINAARAQNEKYLAAIAPSENAAFNQASAYFSAILKERHFNVPDPDIFGEDDISFVGTDPAGAKIRIAFDPVKFVTEKPGQRPIEILFSGVPHWTAGSINEIQTDTDGKTKVSMVTQAYDYTQVGQTKDLTLKEYFEEKSSACKEADSFSHHIGQMFKNVDAAVSANASKFFQSANPANLPSLDSYSAGAGN